MRATRFLFGLSLLTICSFASAAPKRSPTRVIASHRADLRGVGKKDLIQLTLRRIPLDSEFIDEFRVVVNGGSGFVVQVDGVPDGISSVDINRTDRVREIDVRATGPSDGEIHLLLRFDGSRIAEVGQLESPRYLGNGIVLDTRRQGFWTSVQKFVLGASHRLKEVPQEFYAVGFSGKIKKPLSLRVNRNKPEILANLRVGSQVLVMLGDLRGWYLVQSENGLLGWMRESEVERTFGILILP